MKMLPEHYAILKEAVMPRMRAEDWAVYQTNGLSFTRYIFDCYWAAWRRTPTLPEFVLGTLYKYLNDDHIGTALKAIAKEAGLCNPAK
jgi:hypothetical protein